MPYINAHAARINDENIVEEVIVIPYCNDNDAEITEYCNSIGLPGFWIDTSWMGSRRGKYAGVGDRYDSELDRFIAPQPYPSWSIDKDGNWNPPIPCPSKKGNYVWDETSGQWINIVIQ